MDNIVELVKTCRVTKGLPERVRLTEAIFHRIERDLRLFVFSAIMPPAGQDVLQEAIGRLPPAWAGSRATRPSSSGAGATASPATRSTTSVVVRAKVDDRAGKTGPAWASKTGIANRAPFGDCVGPHELGRVGVLQRRTGLCGDATRAPSGALQTAGRAGLAGPACPAVSSSKAVNPRGFGGQSPPRALL